MTVHLRLVRTEPLVSWEAITTPVYVHQVLTAITVKMKLTSVLSALALMEDFAAI